MTEEDMRRRGARYARPGERVVGPHMVRGADGRDVMNPAGTVGNALPAAGGGGLTRRRGGAEGMGPGQMAPAPAVGMGPGQMAPMPEMVLTPFEEEALRMPAAGGGLPQRRGGAEGMGPMPAPVLAPFEEEALRVPAAAPAMPALPAPERMPRVFTDSDGVARVGFDMGGMGGLGEADEQGVPAGVVMAPVRGLEQGRMWVGRPEAVLPPAPVDVSRMEDPAERYGMGANQGRWNVQPGAPATGFDPNALPAAPEESELARARRKDKDSTRELRWDQSGPTSAVNRAVSQQQSQGAAMDALNRQTTEQIRLAQGTPQVAAGTAGNVAWDPKAGQVVSDIRPEKPVAERGPEEKLAHLAQVLKVVSGGDMDMMTLMRIEAMKDPVLRKQAMDAATKANPEVMGPLVAQMLALLAQMGGGAAAGGSGQSAGGSGDQTGPKKIRVFR